MTISPPLGVGAILAVSVIAMAVLAPAPSSDAVLSVRLPAAVYAKLAREAQGRIGADGRSLSVEQALAALAQEPRR